MEYYVNHQQMKAIDQYSIQNVGIPSLVLMERAALAVAERIMEIISPDQGRILSICAMGNNGADGLAVARILKLKGYDTAVCCMGSSEKATEEWKTQYQILLHLGIACTFLSDCNREQIGEYIKEEKAAVLVDALFGIGLTREIKGSYKEFICGMNESGIPIVSVDIPSGIDSDCGKIAGAAVKAQETITFGRKKLGQIFYPGAEYCGHLTVCEIGFAPEAVKKAGYDAFGLTREDLHTWLKPRPADSHKGTFGKILVIAGSKNMAGAAVFSARAAYRMGCGLVKVHTVEENRSCMHQMVPEAILSVYEDAAYEKPFYTDKKDLVKENRAMEQLKQDCEWADVIVFGPGMGKKNHVHVILKELLFQTSCPLILDADGLRVLAEHKNWYQQLSERIIVTPHLGEMSALTGLRIAEIQQNPVETAQKFADENGCICVLKGARTIVAKKGTPYYLNTSGCSAMATAGSGDVLTGILAGYLAEGHSTMEAASYGVFTHGLAGEAACMEYGERSVMATDLIEALGQVLK